MTIHIHIHKHVQVKHAQSLKVRENFKLRYYSKHMNVPLAHLNTHTASNYYVYACTHTPRHTPHS